jgi:hypothetical protein
MSIGPEIASKKFAIFPWAGRALYPAADARKFASRKWQRNDEAPAFAKATERQANDE